MSWHGSRRPNETVFSSEWSHPQYLPYSRRVQHARETYRQLALPARVPDDAYYRPRLVSQCLHLATKSRCSTVACCPAPPWSGPAPCGCFVASHLKAGVSQLTLSAHAERRCPILPRPGIEVGRWPCGASESFGCWVLEVSNSLNCGTKTSLAQPAHRAVFFSCSSCG